MVSVSHAWETRCSLRDVPRKLEEQLVSKPPPAKRARKTNDVSALAEPSSSAPAPAASGSTKAEGKKRKLQLKKIFDRYASMPGALAP